MQKWVISLISTDYDLHDIRQSLISELEFHDFDISAFEKDNFPVEPHMHSHNACVAALDRVDIVVLIIDQRYGGLYIGDTNISITEKEFETAISSKKIFIPCVRNKVWNEKNTFSKLLKSAKTLKQQERIRRDSKPSYAENWEVFDFIDRVGKLDTDNYLIFFDEAADLKTKIIGRLEKLSRFLCQKIIESQVKYVQSLKTTTGLALSFGDVLNGGFYIDPPFKIKSGSNRKFKKIDEYIKLLLNDQDEIGILFIGEPGIGKSTLILKSFVENAKNIENLYALPFYISLRGEGTDYHFSFEEYINDCFNYYLQKEKYPLLCLTDIKPILYIDGFDEISNDYSNLNISDTVLNNFFSKKILVTSRTYFSKIFLNNIDFGNKISLIIEIQNWNITHAKKYVRNFCTKRDRKDLIEKIDKLLVSSEELKQIYKNPLLLSLYLWIIEDSEMELPFTVSDRISLYDQCLTNLSKRESFKLGISESDLYNIWMKTCWELYKKRFDNIFLSISDLSELNPSVEIKPQLFNSLFHINNYKEISGTIHEQFLEFFVSKYFNESLLSRNHRTDFFEIVLKPEINRIIRTLWRHESDSNKSLILDTLWSIYKNHLASRESKYISIRTHVVYHIGRMPIQEASSLLSEALDSENNIAVRLSIYFGLIKRGDILREQELYDLLKMQEDWDCANRGYHLVYYSDWAITNETPPFYDNGSHKWERTLQALLEHICSNRDEHYYLRRIELFTIKRFYEVTNEKTLLSDEIMQKIESALKIGKIEDFDKKIADEFNGIKKLII